MPAVWHGEPRRMTAFGEFRAVSRSGQRARYNRWNLTRPAFLAGDLI